MKEAIGRTVGTGLAAACLAVPIAACGSIEHASSKKVTPEEQTRDCYSPTQQEIHLVDSLFSKPALGTTNPEYSQTVTIEGDKRGFVKTGAIAKHFGLYIPPQGPEATVESDYFTHVSYNKLFKDTSAFLGEYGVRVSIAKPDELEGGTVPTKSQLSNHTASYEIAEIAQGFSGLPIQYIQFTGLKKVVLAAGTKDDAAYAETSGADNTVVVDVTHLFESPQLLDHEMYHLLDYRECRGISAMFHDPGYEAIAGNIYNHKKSEITLESSSINSLTSKLIQEQNESGNAAACHNQSELDDLLNKAVAYSNYSLTNVVEDKAEIGKNITGVNDYSIMLASQTPIVKRKFEFLLARLYHFKPKIVDYLAAVSTRPFYSYYNMIKKCK